MKNTLHKIHEYNNELLEKVLKMCESLNVVNSIFDQIVDQIEHLSK